MFRFEKPLFGPGNWLRVAVFLLFNLLFIGLTLAWLWFRSADDANSLAQDSASKVVQLMDRALQGTENTLQRIAPLTSSPCEQISPSLQMIGSLAPYVRSLFLVDLRKETLYCSSSAYLKPGVDLHLAELLGNRDRQQVHFFWSVHSPLSANRGLVIYRPVNQARAVAAVLEGRNFEDLLQVLTSPYIDRITIDIPPLALENNQGRISLQAVPSEKDLRARQRSTHFNLWVSVHTRPDLLRQLALTHLPLAVSLVLLFLLASGYVLWGPYGPAAFFRRAVNQGLVNAQFEPFYQPIVLPDGSLYAVEVLIRWRSALKGLIPPSAFIAKAEAQNLLTPIMCALLRRVAEDLADKPLPHNSRVSINLTAQQLGDNAMLEAVLELNQRLQARQYVLVVEVTEEGLIQDARQARSAMEKLRTAGMLIAIDDFGIGNSSLSYLRQFPFDYLKIDKSFVDGVPGQQKDMAIVEGIVSLAQQLELSMVAEGVEQQAQADYLQLLGVEHFQGYLFSRPLPLAELVRFVQG
jgi:EAL domain-containing protein (putative c-di-GMP-specific phosphodiesterase class I)